MNFGQYYKNCYELGKVWEMYCKIFHFSCICKPKQTIVIIKGKNGIEDTKPSINSIQDQNNRKYLQFTNEKYFKIW